MKRAFQVLAVLLAIGAIAQTLSGTTARAESNKSEKSTHEPGV